MRDWQTTGRGRNIVSRIGTGADGYDEIGGGRWANICDAVLVVRTDESHRSRAQAIPGSVHCDFDRAFADQPHLRVHVMVWWMRSAPRRQSGFVYFERLARRQLPFQHGAELSVVRGLNGQLV